MVNVILPILSSAVLVLYLYDLSGSRAPRRVTLVLAATSVLTAFSLGVVFPLPLALVSVALAPCLALLTLQAVRPSREPSDQEKAYCIGCLAVPVIISAFVLISARA